MKTKNILIAFSLALIYIIGNYNFTRGQCPTFCLPANPDNQVNATPAPTSVSNTGNDASEKMLVMVWDESSATARFAYDDLHNNLQNYFDIVGSNSTTGRLKDPDVAMWQYHDDFAYIVIVYLDNFDNQIYYDVYLYDFVSPAITFPKIHQPLSNPAGCALTAASSNPNVDITHEPGFPGYAVANWEQDDEIWTNAIELTANPANIATTCSCPFRVQFDDVFPFNDQFYSSPDVTVNENFDPGKTERMVSYVYKELKSVGTQQVHIRQINLSNIVSCSPITFKIDETFYPSLVPSTHTIGPPRIASPSKAAVFSETDFEVVLRHNDTNGDNIFGVNKYNNTKSGPKLLNPDLESDPCINRTPAVDYVEDFIIVVWSYFLGSPTCMCMPVSDVDVIARRFHVDGQNVDNCFSIVNIATISTEHAPSISMMMKKPTAPASPAKAFYTWWEASPNIDDIWYKTSFYTNQYLKWDFNNEESTETAINGSSQQTMLELFPNPSSDEVNIKINLVEDEKATQLDIYNITGQKVAHIDLADLEEGTHIIVWNGKSDKGTKLEPGLYLIRMETSYRSILHKLFRIQ